MGTAKEIDEQINKGIKNSPSIASSVKGIAGNIKQRLQTRISEARARNSIARAQRDEKTQRHKTIYDKAYANEEVRQIRTSARRQAKQQYSKPKYSSTNNVFLGSDMFGNSFGVPQKKKKKGGGLFDML